MINFQNKVVFVSPSHTIEALKGLLQTPIGQSRTYLINGVALQAEFVVRPNKTISVDANGLLGAIHSLGFLLDIFGSNEGEKNVADLTIDKELASLGIPPMDTKTIHNIYRFLNWSIENLEVESKA